MASVNSVIEWLLWFAAAMAHDSWLTAAMAHNTRRLRLTVAIRYK